MDKQRRTGLLAAASLMALGPSAVKAQGAFPNRPVKIIVPYLPGGSVDPVARMLGDKLSAMWGQPVVIDNKPGASTIIGTDFVAKAPADGYTILLTANTHVSNPMLFPNLPFDSVNDFTPVVPVNTAEFVLTTFPSFKGNTLKEVIAEVKANPGKYTYASAGVGNIVHLAMELFQMQTGTKIVHVPYKGANQIIPDLVSGQVHLYLSVPVTIIPFLKDGKVKGLATTAKLPALPNVPTFAEAGLPEFTIRSWLGFMAPAKTPRDVVMKLNADISKVLQMPDVRDKLIGQGQNPWILSPEGFADAMRKDAAEYARVIKAANIKMEQ